MVLFRHIIITARLELDLSQKFSKQMQVVN